MIKHTTSDHYVVHITEMGADYPHTYKTASTLHTAMMTAHAYMASLEVSYGEDNIEILKDKNTDTNSTLVEKWNIRTSGINPIRVSVEIYIAEEVAVLV